MRLRFKRLLNGTLMWLMFLGNAHETSLFAAEEGIPLSPGFGIIKSSQDIQYLGISPFSNITGTTLEKNGNVSATLSMSEDDTKSTSQEKFATLGDISGSLDLGVIGFSVGGRAQFANTADTSDHVYSYTLNSDLNDMYTESYKRTGTGFKLSRNASKGYFTPQNNAFTPEGWLNFKSKFGNAMIDKISYGAKLSLSFKLDNRDSTQTNNIAKNSALKIDLATIFKKDSSTSYALSDMQKLASYRVKISGLQAGGFSEKLFEYTLPAVNCLNSLSSYSVMPESFTASLAKPELLSGIKQVDPQFTTGTNSGFLLSSSSGLIQAIVTRYQAGKNFNNKLLNSDPVVKQMFAYQQLIAMEDEIYAQQAKEFADKSYSQKAQQLRSQSCAKTLNDLMNYPVKVFTAQIAQVSNSSNPKNFLIPTSISMKSYNSLNTSFQSSDGSPLAPTIFAANTTEIKELDAVDTALSQTIAREQKKLDRLAAWVNGANVPSEIKAFVKQTSDSMTRKIAELKAYAVPATLQKTRQQTRTAFIPTASKKISENTTKISWLKNPPGAVFLSKTMPATDPVPDKPIDLGAAFPTFNSQCDNCNIVNTAVVVDSLPMLQETGSVSLKDQLSKFKYLYYGLNKKNGQFIEQSPTEKVSDFTLWLFCGYNGVPFPSSMNAAGQRQIQYGQPGVLVSLAPNDKIATSVLIDELEAMCPASPELGSRGLFFGFANKFDEIMNTVKTLSVAVSNGGEGTPPANRLTFSSTAKVSNGYFFPRDQDVNVTLRGY